MDASEEDPKIRLLRAAARARAADEGSPWDRLATGTLPDDERAALEADESDDARLRRELFRPLSAEEKGRIADGVIARLRKDGAARRRRVTVIGAAVLAAAAAMGPLFLRGGAPKVEVAWSGTLGTADAPIQRLIAADAPLGAAIVPLHPVEGALRIRGAALVRDGHAIAWDPHANPTTADNQIYLPGTRRELFPCLREGEWTILVAVGVEGPPVAEDELMRGAEKGPQRGYQVLRKQVWLGPPIAANGEKCSGAVR